MPRPKSEMVEGKPPFSYVTLCALAISESKSRMVTLAEIYEYIMTRFPYYRNKSTKWQNSLRHNLSFNDCFVKVAREGGGKGNFWALHPSALKMFEHGTYQRRKKRFKVEETSSDGRIKTGAEGDYPETYGIQYAPYYTHDMAVHTSHERYMQQQIREQAICQQPYLIDDNVQIPHEVDNEPIHTPQNEDIINSREDILPYTIESILRPDSPKRKKKVYSSTENVKQQGPNSKSIQSKNKEMASFSRLDVAAPNASIPAAPGGYPQCDQYHLSTSVYRSLQLPLAMAPHYPPVFFPSAHSPPSPPDFTSLYTSNPAYPVLLHDPALAYSAHGSYLQAIPAL